MSYEYRRFDRDDDRHWMDVIDWKRLVRGRRIRYFGCLDYLRRDFRYAIARTGWVEDPGCGKTSQQQRHVFPNLDDGNWHTVEVHD